MSEDGAPGAGPETEVPPSDPAVSPEELEALRRFRRIVSATPDAVSLVDRDYEYRIVNDAYLERSGRTREEIVGHRVEEVLGSEAFHGLVKEKLDRCLAGETVRYRSWFDYEGVGRRYADVTYSPYREEDGTVTGVVVAARDLTELRRAQDALQESEARYRAVIETQADGFAVLDREGRVLEANDAYVIRSGYSREELLGMCVADLDADEGEAGAAAHLEKVVREGSDLFETRHRAKDGTVWPVEVDTSYWPIDGGRFFAFVRDLNRRKRAEMLLRTRLRLSELAADGGLDDVLQAALDTAELFTGSRIGFFHFVEEDQEHLTLQTWSTNTLRNICSAEGKGLHYPISHAGVWVDCVRTGAPVIHNDYASLPHRKGLPPGHAPVARELVVPIFREGKVVAVMGVGNKAAPYTDDDVEPVRELGSMIVDLAMRRRAEARLQESERRFREVAAAVPGALYQFERHPDGSFAVPFMSESAARFLERPLAELMDAGSLLGGVHPDDLAELHRSIERSAASLEPWSLDFRVVLPRGGTRWIQGRSVPHRAEDGTIVWTGVLLDITERKNAEQAIREKERRYRRLLESTRTVPWEMDLASGRFTYMGPQAEAIFGYPRESWVDLQTWIDRVHPDDREAASRTCAEATARGEDHSFEYRAVRADGEVLWILDEVSVVHGANGAERLLGFLRDITEPRRQAQERARLEDQLRQAQKMEAIGALAGGIAHDFNNILTPIMAHADFALMSLPQGSPVADELSQLLVAAERARALVAQILAISRREEEHARVPVDLGALVRETVKFLRSSLPTTIDIRVAVDPACRPVLGEASRLHQVLLNLCTNARDAMASQGGTLTVSLTPAAPGAAAGTQRDGSWVELAVRDTGTGIAPELLDRIFEPYFTTKPRGKGTGLGLAVAHGIVAGMGGEMRARSAPGKGTTFEILLPGTEAAGAVPPRGRAEVPRGRGEAVLVVDDEAPVRAVVEKILEALGYRPTVLGSAAEALDAVRVAPEAYDLVLTDYTMPGMTGLDLAGALLPLRRNLPILLCTGFAEAVDEQTVAALGLRGLVLKPYTVQKLAVAIRRALNGADRTPGAG